MSRRRVIAFATLAAAIVAVAGSTSPVAAPQAARSAFPPRPVKCTQSQLNAAFGPTFQGSLTPANCLEDFTWHKDTGKVTADSALTITPSSTDIAVPKKALAKTPVSFTLSASVPICGKDSTGNCWYGGNVDTGGLLPLDNTAQSPVATDASCYYDSNWQSRCRGSEYLLSDDPLQQARRSTHWVLVTAEVIVEGTAAEGFAQQATEYSQTPIRVTVGGGCATSGAGCPLTVSVKRLERLRSGLAVHLQPYNQFPVDFVDSQPQAGFNGPLFRCESGCTDLVVTVTDPKTHKPVTGASVNAGMSGAGPAIAHGSGSESLCSTGDSGLDEGNCGSHLLGLKTDAQGQVTLNIPDRGVEHPEPDQIETSSRTGASAGPVSNPITKRTSSASARRSRVDTLTRCWPDSMREIAEWLVPIRSASCS